MLTWILGSVVNTIIILFIVYFFLKKLTVFEAVLFSLVIVFSWIGTIASAILGAVYGLVWILENIDFDTVIWKRHDTKL